MKYICLGYLESGNSKTCQRAKGTPCWTAALRPTRSSSKDSSRHRTRGPLFRAFARM
jgi:hypothetical protein